MKLGSVKRMLGIAAAATLALALSACLLSAGKFSSDLDIRKSGDFTFRYNGELIFLPLTEKPESQKIFEAQPCYPDEGFEERDCTAQELTDQKSDWEKKEARRMKKDKRDAESAKAFLGGIDPSDPKSAEELADRLRRQAGWNKVEYRGNGVFDIEFAISSSLDHDFVFPALERFSMANAFVQISRRRDGTVRIDAPGYGQSSSPMGMMGMGGMMQSAIAEGGSGSGSDDKPVMDGHFTIRTDATILANNTDEGPKADPAGQRLDWKVSARTQSAPTALLRLSN